MREGGVSVNDLFFEHLDLERKKDTEIRCALKKILGFFRVDRIGLLSLSGGKSSGSSRVKRLQGKSK
jgi:hypothetical protein